MRVGITGATGFVGKRLVELAARESGLQVRILSRNAKRARALFPIPDNGLSPIEIAEWDYEREVPSFGVLSGVDAVIHLAGENVAGRRWTPAQKKRIRDSRVLSTRNLIEGIKRQRSMAPKTLICASAIGYYGPHGDEEIAEDAAPGNDFLADVCQDWEAEARRAEVHGLREARVRVGVVLGSGGGALVPMVAAFKKFAGGRMGSGKQWMSWVHRDDLVRLFLHLLENESLHGAFNGTAPQPVRNADFTTALGDVLQRPTLLPAPGFGMRILLGEFADLLVTGQRVLSKRAVESGFEFQYPELRDALREILGSRVESLTA
jgi:uncharacterized protein (TIGR01777 family)